MAEKTEDYLARPVEHLPGVGPKRAGLLANLGIASVRDLLMHFPRDYQDRTRLTPIAEVAEGDSVTIEAEVARARSVPLRRRMSVAVVTLRDGTGDIKATWFGRGFLAQALKPGARGLFSGRVGQYKGLALRNPDYEMLTCDDEDRVNTGRIVPIYPLTEKVTQRMLRGWVATALDGLGGPPPDGLPPRLRERHGFPGTADALRQVHFPDSLEAGQKARARFAYEELLGVQLGVLSVRAARLHEEKGLRHRIGGPLATALARSLPFPLTAAQTRAVNDILADMASPRPMVRLVQGDVGCGKTVVALHAVAAAADGGYQTAFMAPTEVLAEQHGLSLRTLLAPLGIGVEVLTGSTSSAAELRQQVAEGAVPVVVGTHALIQDGTSFKNLGLAVIDEQHRFGVVQRSRLVEKGPNPDILHMTATPIPRTLAITVYGGMDVTVIGEMPPGRTPVKTRRVTPAKVPGLYGFIREQAAKGFQTYIVCPLVEESATRDLTAVTSHFDELRRGPLAGLRVGLMHGRLAPREKEVVMRRFKDGDLDVLVSTTVIEVGIDAPRATVMVIEDAPQFGLTQLHQLRGRVGRGTDQSYCFLLGKPATKDGWKRLEVMCATTSGFDVAEEDLLLRGPGEFSGVRQAGMSDLRVADLVRDVRLLDAARRDAREILSDDPQLACPDHHGVALAARRFSDITA